MKKIAILILAVVGIAVATCVAFRAIKEDTPSASVEYLAGADGIYALRVHFRNYDRPFAWSLYMSEREDVDGVDTEVAKYPVAHDQDPAEITSLSILLYQSYRRTKEKTGSNPNFKFRFHWTTKAGFGVATTGAEAQDGVTLPVIVKASMHIKWAEKDTITTGNRVRVGTIRAADRKYDIIIETSFQQSNQPDPK